MAEATKALERRMLCGVGLEAYLRFLVVFEAVLPVDFDLGVDFEDFEPDFAEVPAFFDDCVVVADLFFEVWFPTVWALEV